MEETDSLDFVLKAKLDKRLGSLIESICLSPISRIPVERLQRSALPNIGLIELVSSESFAKDYDSLYLSNFHGGERERSDLIVSRLSDDFAGKRNGLAPYRIIGIRNAGGQAIAGAQFSVLFLKDGKNAVPYLQYIYVRAENRRQDLSEVLHTLILAVSIADAANIEGAATHQVPFTLFETEPPVHGADEVKRANASERSKIHSKSGGSAMMLRRRSDGKVLSAHVQPGLEVGEPPLTLIWALRANPAVQLVLSDDRMGRGVIAAYYQSLRDEGFPGENIALAEQMVGHRYEGGIEFCLMPLSDISQSMYIGIDEQRSVEECRCNKSQHVCSCASDCRGVYIEVCAYACVCTHPTIRNNRHVLATAANAGTVAEAAGGRLSRLVDAQHWQYSKVVRERRVYWRPRWTADEAARLYACWR